MVEGSWEEVQASENPDVRDFLDRRAEREGPDSASILGGAA